MNKQAPAETMQTHIERERQAEQGRANIQTPHVCAEQLQTHKLSHHRDKWIWIHIIIIKRISSA